MATLFDPITLGAIEAPNRILMAPMTRGRSDQTAVPNDLMRLYYKQRAGAGLIITESIGISQQGLGWPNAPGIWNAEQVEGWKRITAAVHAANGRIMAQLWHMGRLVHPSFLAGEAPVSCSATTAPGHAYTYAGTAPYERARALDLNEIPRIVDDYVRAAGNAINAGFDGVQLHAANGYLIDQFLRDSSNLRDDMYGGSVDNRIRLMLEIAKALCDEVGALRVAVRLSPNGDAQGVDDSKPEILFTAAAAALDKLGIAFLELREPDASGTFGKTEVPRQSSLIRTVFKGPLITNSDRTMAEAAAEIASGVADAVSFGRPFISNPDLPFRFAKGAELVPSDPATWFSQGAEGYTSYPANPR
ncbi:alkene reductase [Sphingosinicella microcystinivorans]|uniref:alkene reductase n=1 Tax=Sphingosinicella microcystinivorans TaxID=335406 RepID=UPI0022F38EB4|nr:alkene reductase [Sphingosinicella microcystinivorans]WBX83761.1 alkene reductase [Sphingosinicella microcystinivorans]